jgi:3-oxoacyl-[acyl-carrier protein] reductase
MNFSVTIITGAGSGIGQHLAQTLASLGHRLCLIDLNVSKTQEILPESEQLFYFTMDVRNTDSWQVVVKETISRYGQVDYLINCAGIVQPSFIYNAALSDVDRHFDINTKGSIYGTMIVGDHMKRQRSGHIINIASLAGIAPIPGIALYSASKFAIRGFTHAAAFEYEPFGVTMSVVCPDLVKTPMYDHELTFNEETALVFSGNIKSLSPADVTHEILTLMKSKKREICIPASRGRLAKLAALWPWLADTVRSSLTKKGLKQMKKLKGE